MSFRRTELSHLQTSDGASERMERREPGHLNGPVSGRLSGRLSGRAVEHRFQHGLYAYYRGDYSEALIELEKVCENAASLGDHARFIETCGYVLRILAEHEEFARIKRIETRVLAILSTVDLPLRVQSRVMYILGICNCYQESQHDQAMNRFREAIDCAIQAEDKEALAAPLYGAATVLYARQRYDEALRQLDRLEVLLSCLQLRDLQSASQLLRSMILRNQNQNETALAAAWLAFDSLKEQPNLVLYLNTLCVLGTLYTAKGDAKTARIYLDLANRTLKRKESPRIARLVDDALAKVTQLRLPSPDIIYDTRTGVLTETAKGEIRFEGQFVLRDLLCMFLQQPGYVFNKEDIVRSVWKQEYSPEIHDNKIYVTIKRLRKLLETEDSPKDYILRAKTGYFLNPKIRILVTGDSLPASLRTDLPTCSIPAGTAEGK
jgi:DNA-binding winged helix-turn-helix (wHTH) protein